MEPIKEEEKEKAELVCKEMWEEVFGDSQEYIAWYFNQKWKENEVFLLQDQKEEVCSMLHINPYQMQIAEKEMLLHYIVGVCTRPDQRKKGYMGVLIKAAFLWLYEREAPFTYLMPAREGIYEPYDFRKIYQAGKELVQQILSMEGTEQYHFVGYEKATQQQREGVETLANQYLSSRFSVYVCRNQRYFQEIAQEMQACHGELLLIYEKDDLKGYLEYGAEENSVEIFEVVGELQREQLYSSFGAYLKERAIGNGEQFQVNVTPFADCNLEQGHCIMARVIHFEKCAELFRSKEKITMKVKINDDYIPQNNKKWQLDIRPDRCQVKPLQEMERVEQEMNIREFCDYFFQEQKVFLNELV